MTQIRPAQLEDIPRLIELDQIAHTEKQRIEFIEKVVNNKSCWVIEVDTVIAGYGVLEHNFYDCGFISMLYFDAAHRKQGLGLELVRYFESICKTDKLFSSTNESNIPAQRLLEKAGFERSGIIHNLDDDDPELVYVKRLNQGRNPGGFDIPGDQYVGFQSAVAGSEPDLQRLLKKSCWFEFFNQGVKEEIVFGFILFEGGGVDDYITSVEPVFSGISAGGSFAIGSDGAGGLICVTPVCFDLFFTGHSELPFWYRAR